ncbi:hypothetical protein T492DRAFT_969616 [Pavlovales sp. CCMP2436]|nr:hypothetical protein T492DRAFT_969616 [Pavlovales sp. CCMP2436]
MTTATLDAYKSDDDCCAKLPPTMTREESVGQALLLMSCAPAAAHVASAAFKRAREGEDAFGFGHFSARPRGDGVRQLSMPEQSMRPTDGAPMQYDFYSPVMPSSPHHNAAPNKYFVTPGEANKYFATRALHGGAPSYHPYSDRPRCSGQAYSEWPRCSGQASIPQYHHAPPWQAPMQQYGAAPFQYSGGPQYGAPPRYSSVPQNGTPPQYGAPQPQYGAPPQYIRAPEEQQPIVAYPGTPMGGEPPDDASEESAAQWSACEDQITTEAVARFGCKWSLISALVPGRTPASVRNRWHRIRRAAKKRETTTDDMGADSGLYKCSRCGMPKKGHVCKLSPADSSRIFSARKQMDRMSSEHAQALLVEPL